LWNTGAKRQKKKNNWKKCDCGTGRDANKTLRWSLKDVGNHHESSSPKAEMLTSCITETINGVGHETHAAQESGFVPVLARLAAIPNADGHRIVFAQIPASQKSTRKLKSTSRRHTVPGLPIIN
jgi:hypothetical protein